MRIEITILDNVYIVEDDFTGKIQFCKTYGQAKRLVNNRLKYYEKW